MSRNIVKAKLDVIFKKIFGSKDNEDILKDFLSQILEIPIETIQSITMNNTETIPETLTGKFSRMDLKMQLNSDKLINVEIQVKEEPDFRDRTLFYWSKMYSSELKSGEEYGELKECICINIINFNMFECGEFHSHFKILEKNRHEVLSDKLSIHFFELKKINKKANPNNRMELWMQLINAETEEELEMLENTNIPTIQKAVLIIKEMSEDEKIQEIARIREKQMHDEATAIGHAKREGRAEGRAEGITIGEEKAKSRLIAVMRKNGMSEEQIQQLLKETN